MSHTIKRERADDVDERPVNEHCHYYQQAVGQMYVAIKDRATMVADLIPIDDVDRIRATKKRICVDGKARARLRGAITTAQSLMRGALGLYRLKREISYEVPAILAGESARVKLSGVLDDRAIKREVAAIRADAAAQTVRLNHYRRMMDEAQLQLFLAMPKHNTIQIRTLDEDPYHHQFAVEDAALVEERVDLARSIVLGDVVVRLISFTDDDDDEGSTEPEDDEDIAAANEADRIAQEQRDVAEMAAADNAAAVAEAAENAEQTKHFECTCCKEIRSIIYLPNQCGHMCVCGICIARLNAYGRALCPICRIPMETTTRIYFPGN